ncbi:ATP-binding protein [Mucilaginibacter sp.]|uniref:ATP-binding protein n=1 Tax=Mucilaginibacter sp. TaxID=1882438 RepID=UPI0035BBB021
MKQGTVTKRFVFNNRAEDLYNVHVEVIDYLTTEAGLDDSANFKLKVVLTELLTNGIKHSGCDKSIIETCIQPDSIRIKKTDAGNSFSASFNGCSYRWPLPGRHFNDTIIHLYGDDNYLLKAKNQNNYRLVFFIEEQPQLSAGNEINNLSEHFGLMIIARACDGFSYEFDIDTCSNNFTATFKR